MSNECLERTNSLLTIDYCLFLFTIHLLVLHPELHIPIIGHVAAHFFHNFFTLFGEFGCSHFFAFPGFLDLGEGHLG